MKKERNKIYKRLTDYGWSAMCMFCFILVLNLGYFLLTISFVYVTFLFVFWFPLKLSIKSVYAIINYSIKITHNYWLIRMNCVLVFSMFWRIQLYIWAIYIKIMIYLSAISSNSICNLSFIVTSKYDFVLYM